MSPGNNCIVLLVDESAAMSAVMSDMTADGTASAKTNAERIATAVNSVLRQLAEGPPCDIALVGYQSTSVGESDIGSRWRNATAGDAFVQSTELSSFCRVEKRTRRVPQPDGSLVESEVDFPVWYEPVLGARSPQIAAFKYCRELLENRDEKVGQPLVIHLFGGSSSDGNPQRAVQELMELSGAPLVVQCHVASTASLVETVYPSKQVFLASPSARDLFARSSELPAQFVEALKRIGLRLHEGARALVSNGKMADVVRCLQLAKEHVKNNQAAGIAVEPLEMVPETAVNQAETPVQLDDEVAVEDSSAVSVEGAENATASLAVPRAALVVFVLDRSVEDPFSGDVNNPCSRLQVSANALLKEISTKESAELPVSVALVSVGSSDGEDVVGGFEGDLAGKEFVAITDLASGPIRVEEESREVSNGVGGIITLRVKTPIYFDCEPSEAGSLAVAFERACSCIAAWSAEHTNGAAPLVVLLTRAAFTEGEFESALRVMGELDCPQGAPVLHAIVQTESPHKSLAYPDTLDDIESEGLRALWDGVSRLFSYDALRAAKLPYVNSESRGIVVNGKFDALVPELQLVVSGTLSSDEV